MYTKIIISMLSQNQTAVTIQKPSEQKKQIFLGHIKPHKGHKVYELNTITGALTEAVINEVSTTLKGGIHKKIITKEGCLYTSALNMHTAQKKFFKHIRNA
ncbi:MAG: hypothetical protein ACXWDO_00255 [Bacteroidia bacterium]